MVTRESSVRTILRLVLVLAMVLPALALRAPRAAAQAPTNVLKLRVVSARTEPNAPGGPVTKGQAVPQFKFLINVDNTGTPTQPRVPGCSPADPGYPDSCDWPSIRAVPGAAPILTQGDQTHLNATTGLTLPPGKYLMSVLAEGYKMDGKHFTVPLQAPGVITVEVQPYPLPSATIRIKVFEDVSSVNGQFDAPAEHGLAGFRVVINDPLGEVTTDVFGNPLCTQYDAAMNPIGITDCQLSDANGDIAVPNLGPNRYDVLVNPPDGENWIETTTLEGSPSWDTWLAEGGTGLDNEFVVAGEPFPWTIFGFVRPTDLLNDTSVTGGVKGTLVSVAVYLPQKGAQAWQGGIWGNLNGAKITGVIHDGWVALCGLQVGDTAVYIQPANPDGSFVIENVPDGDYLFSWWDQRIHYILDWMQVTVANGEVYDMGNPFLTGWFTNVSGHVFHDLNSNGKRDPDEPGISDYLIVLKDRDNTEIDRMSISAITDPMGHYQFEKAYPMGSWMVLEAYSDRYYTTGVTYHVENQPMHTTVLGNGVDVGLLPMLGQMGHLDWGVRPYETGTNGGIVGTVFYDVTRNELDPRYAVIEGWSPGIPDLTLELYAAVRCGTTPGALCDPTGNFELAADGSHKKGALLNRATTETWEQPVDCTARDAFGNELLNPQDQEVLPPSTGGYRCLEGPLMGTQFQSGFATLDGNFAFTTIFSPSLGAPGAVEEPIPAGDYLVKVVIPNDAYGRSKYKVTKEEDINVFGGDQYVPQVPPPACAGALHVVDVAGVAPNGASAVYNPSFAAEGGSPFEGASRPLCDIKQVTLNNGKSIAPTFTLFTDVPIPGKWKGYIINDLALSTNPQELNFGEKAGMSNAPIGIYDFANRLVATIQSDPNGVFEVLLPSTFTTNCPSPTGVCANVYYMLGNDPGQPGRLNPNYSPQFRTIGASFEVWPGALLPSDLAPTQMVAGVLAAGSQFSSPPQCQLDAGTPQIFAVNRPYHDVTGGVSFQLEIRGQGFGTLGPRSQVTLDISFVEEIISWTDTRIAVRMRSSSPVGPRQLRVTADNGKTTINAITYHVLGTGYKPDMYEVGPGKPYATIQAAVNAAAARPTRNALVVVYPGAPALWNPTGAYFENVVISTPIKLQGVGPGGFNGATYIPGSVIDGRGIAGDTAYATTWRSLVLGLTWDGNQAVYEGATIYVLSLTGRFTSAYRAAIDGFRIQGGDQQGFPNLRPVNPGAKSIVAVQGGGIFANAYARYLQISNNVLESNGGAYGGAIRIGTPHLPGAANDNQNDFVRITNNRILANGGTNLAGGIGLFSGAEGYEVANNDICGCFSAEYGGGISHYGYSPNGKIHNNRVYFNRSYDEGGGIMIAGELPASPTALSPGSGPVDVYSNLIQANLSNDDGGGLRFLMAGNYAMNVYNNIIVNNISTHEGGGVALNDASNVRFYSNTVMKNITTATALTSNGSPAPAGLSTSRNSLMLQATLPPGSRIYSDPLLFNNIFWENRAGSWSGTGVLGIGLPNDTVPINYWDLGVADGSGLLTPTNCVLQTTKGTVPHASNVSSNPQVIAQYETSVRVLPWRANPRFVDPLMVTVDATPNVMGDYHITSASPAKDKGTPSKGAILAPTTDYDGQARPVGTQHDIGADEVAATALAFPLTSVLDSFNRADGPLGANWSGDTASFRIFGFQAQVLSTGSLWWNPASFGANQEAFFTFNKVVTTSPEMALILKFNGSSPAAAKAALIEVVYNSTTGTVLVRTQAPTRGWLPRAAWSTTFAAGDRFGARALTDGTVTVFKNAIQLGSVNIKTASTPWPTALVEGGGRIGVRFVAASFASPNDPRFDAFGGGTIFGAVLAPPTGLVPWIAPPPQD